MKRIERLERRLAGIPVPPTPEEKAQRDARRLELASAALEGREPKLFTEEERLLFQKAVFYAPVFQELVDEGLLDSYLLTVSHDGPPEYEDGGYHEDGAS